MFIKPKNLRKRLRASIDDFRQFGDVVETADGPMIFQDNGADILAVAHLDTVDETSPRFKGNHVFCPQLDDRLGAWVLIDVLPKLGIKYDLLLTDSEEIGRSTARYFTPPRQYNWGFEFDRQGTDVVMYEYETPDLVTLIESYGLIVGDGAFSDICDLDLGVSCFNWGVGYHKQHTRQCYADLRQTTKMVRSFEQFYHDNKDVKLEHAEWSESADHSNSNSWDEWEKWCRSKTSKDWSISGYHTTYEELQDMAHSFGYPTIEEYVDDYRLYEKSELDEEYQLYLDEKFGAMAQPH